jgi:hypothetical protein
MAMVLLLWIDLFISITSRQPTDDPIHFLHFHIFTFGIFSSIPASFPTESGRVVGHVFFGVAANWLLPP